MQEAADNIKNRFNASENRVLGGVV